jgi:spoIIIJ-associated protein
MPKKLQPKIKTKEVGDNVKVVSLSKEIIGQLLKLIGIKSEVEVSYEPENDCINVDIKADEEAGLLIGKKGETVNSLQKFMSLSLRKATGEWHRVVVNVADWREKQRMRLEELASQAAERARETGEIQNLYNLTPGQRRIIHLFLSNEKDIKTESVGEGKERYLVVSVVK